VFWNMRSCLCKSHDVEIVQDAAGVFNTERQDTAGIGGKKGNIHPSFCDFLVQLVRYDKFDAYPALVS